MPSQFVFLPCLTTHTFAEHVHSFSKEVIITSFNLRNELFHQLPSGQRVSNFQKQEHSFSFCPSTFCPSVFNLVAHYIHPHPTTGEYRRAFFDITLNPTTPTPPSSSPNSPPSVLYWITGDLTNHVNKCISVWVEVSHTHTATM